jgi:hypothetical protein
MRWPDRVHGQQRTIHCPILDDSGSTGEDFTFDKTVQALSKFGGAILKASMPKDVEAQLQEALN